MATYIKSNVRFTPAVEQINRKWAVKKKTCAAPSEIGPVKTQPNSWMGSGTRQTYRGKIGTVSRNYFVFRENARLSAVSSAELEARALFEAVKKATDLLMKDLMQISRIQAMFLGGNISGTDYVGAANDASVACNGVHGSGYTLRGWVFAVQYAGKKEDSEYNLANFPTAYDA